VAALDVPVYRGTTGQVVGDMHAAMLQYYPQAKLILRGMGDCPFMATELIELAAQKLLSEQKDAFVWALPPWIWPVYGAREFPYSREGWERIVARTTEQVHVDTYFHTHRGEFNILYHEPPPSKYFRPYRLEVDWPEDLAMVRALAKKVPPLVTVPTVLKALDDNPQIARLNHARVERTGPSCYTYEQQRAWMNEMRGQPIYGWDKTLWTPPSEKAEPIFCEGGICLLGYGDHGTLHRLNGDMIRGDARVSCACGAGKRWHG